MIEISAKDQMRLINLSEWRRQKIPGSTIEITTKPQNSIRLLDACGDPMDIITLADGKAWTKDMTSQAIDRACAAAGYADLYEPQR